MRQTSIGDGGMSRRALVTGIAATIATLSVTTRPAAAAIRRNLGNFRSINLQSPHTGDWIRTVYWADGKYVPDALGELDHVLRDWRTGDVVRMDARTVDIVAACQKMLDASEPFQIISGYRCPATNAMLRRESSGVALNSYHLKGMAIDVSMRSRSVHQISRAGLHLGAGGVGLYTDSDFVHLDSGPRRTWGA